MFCTIFNGLKKSFIMVLFKINWLVGDQKKITWKIILVEPITFCYVIDIADGWY